LSRLHVRLAARLTAGLVAQLTALFATAPGKRR
jgi:hypothetical protein